MEHIIKRGPMGITGGYANSIDITDSTIDMNFKKITSLADPTGDYDAVNFRTLNSLIGVGFITSTVTLTSTGWTNISLLTRGSYTINVMGLLPGSPCAIFMVSKAYAAENVNVSRMVSSSGQTTSERLAVRWLANQPMQLSKDGVSWDGLYNIKIY